MGSSQHPVLAGAAQVHALLDAVLGSAASAVPLGAGEHEVAVTEWSRALSRVEALRLRLMASPAAVEAAAAQGMTGADAWLAARTRGDRARAAGTVRLAGALAGGFAATGAALEAGVVSPEHAQVIVRAAEQLPDGLGEAERAEVERSLVEQATRLDPAGSAQGRPTGAGRGRGRPGGGRCARGRRADRRGGRVARDRSRLTLHDNADGTVSGTSPCRAWPGRSCAR